MRQFENTNVYFPISGNDAFPISNASELNKETCQKGERNLSSKKPKNGNALDHGLQCTSIEHSKGIQQITSRNLRISPYGFTKIIETHDNTVHYENDNDSAELISILNNLKGREPVRENKLLNEKENECKQKNKKKMSFTTELFGNGWVRKIRWKENGMGTVHCLTSPEGQRISSSIELIAYFKKSRKVMRDLEFYYPKDICRETWKPATLPSGPRTKNVFRTHTELLGISPAFFRAESSEKRKDVQDKKLVTLLKEKKVNSHFHISHFHVKGSFLRFNFPLTFPKYRCG